MTSDVVPKQDFTAATQIVLPPRGPKPENNHPKQSNRKAAQKTIQQLELEQYVKALICEEMLRHVRRTGRHSEDSKEQSMKGVKDSTSLSRRDLSQFRHILEINNTEGNVARKNSNRIAL